MTVRAADPEPRWRVLNQAARAAIEAKDYPKLRAALLEVRPLLPGNPRVIYNLAASNALLGDKTAALGWLSQWAAMGLVYDIATDDDFATLRGSPEFLAISKRVDGNKRPVAQGVSYLAIGERDVIPEDISPRPGRGGFFISSVRKSKILTSEGAEFAKTDWPVLALAVDQRRRTLWATTGWVPHCEHCQKSDEGKTALLGFDLNSGTLKQRIDSPLPGLLGDMTIGRHGDLYISEGIHGAVLKKAAGSNTLERLDVPGDFPSPQTPALSADEKTLYIPDYVRGIAAMNLSARTVEWLQPAPGIALSGIDGLYVYRDSFLAVQNGTSPPRIMRFSLDLQRQEVLEANVPGLGEPTHGTVVKGVFYYLANSGWATYDAQGQQKPGTAPVESAVRKIRLTPKIRQ